MRKLFTLLAYAERDLQLYLSVGRPESVCPISFAHRAVHCCASAAVRPAGRRSIAARPALSSSGAAAQCSAENASSVKVTAEHKLVKIGSAIYKKAATFVCHVVNKCTRAFGTQLFVK